MTITQSTDSYIQGHRYNRFLLDLHHIGLRQSDLPMSYTFGPENNVKFDSHTLGPTLKLFQSSCYLIQVRVALGSLSTLALLMMEVIVLVMPESFL
jgi:hypothetical protein